MKNTNRILFILVLAFVGFAAQANAQTMSTYSWQPPVVADSSRPNTMILLSNDWTGFTRGYKGYDDYDDGEEYWGYFDPDKYYEWNTPKGPFIPIGYNEFGTHKVPASAGASYWSGNFLNWVTMSNVDFMRKALTGGKRSADSIGNVELIRGNIAGGQSWKKNYTGSDFDRLVPSAYASADNEFYNTGTTFTVQNKFNSNIIGSPFEVQVKVCADGMVEDNCKYYPQVDEAKPEGLLQAYADKMRFAMMTYSHAMPEQGGVLRKMMGDIRGEWSHDGNGQVNLGTNDTMIRYINNYTSKGWDPLAEMYYEAIRYFKGNKGASQAYCDPGNFISDDGFSVAGCEANKDWGDDPIIDWCQKNNIIIFNDEYPSREHDSLPGSTHNPSYAVATFAGGNNNPYDIDVAEWTRKVGEHEGIHASGTTWTVGNILGGVEDGSCNLKSVPDLADAHGICPTEPSRTTNGTFYLAGIAHHAFTNDLRSDHDGVQNIRTWTLAYRATAAAVYQPPIPPMNQMYLAAKYGNFNDLNGNLKPDAGEWADKNRTDAAGNPYPYAYFPADSGKELVDAIAKIFDAILETTASGTAVSVLANSGQGEGNLVQAYYRPRLSLGEASVDWIGFLQSLWIDEYGYIREDTIQDKILNPYEDKVVRYVETGGTTKAEIYSVSPADPFPDFTTDLPATVALEDVKVLWDAGRLLAQTNPINRKIFTFIDKDKNGYVEERRLDAGTIVSTPETDVFNDDGEVLQFYDRNYRDLMPYLNVEDDTLHRYLGRSQKIRALNLVRWVQGYDQSVNPTRFVDINNIDTRIRTLDASTGEVFKLGDIINSTPVTVAAPPDAYNLIYSDESYQGYYDTWKNRETTVYVGANDGMLHAFTSWKFNRSLSSFVDPDPSTTESIGSELWAYIPQNLLPHLKWQPRNDYSHVYYVDLQPRIFDARVFYDSSGAVIDPTKHINGWGTILVGGYGIGGGVIDVTDRFDDGSGTRVMETRSFKPSFFAIDITDPREPELLWDRSYDELGMSSVFPTVMRVDDENFVATTAAPDNPGVWYLVFGSGPDAGDRSLSLPPQYDGESGDNAYFYAVDVLTGDPYQSTDTSVVPNVQRDYLFATTETNAFMGPPVSYDKNLNYNTDAAYIPVTYDNGTTSNHDWKGAMYKVTVPWKGPLNDDAQRANYGNTGVADYTNDPLDATYPWYFSKMFASPRPITASAALSVDHVGNTWVYFGTGRMFQGEDVDGSDFASPEVEYLFGIKDPFFNKPFHDTPPAITDPFPYYLEYDDGGGNFLAKTLVTTDLFDADPYAILTTGAVYEKDGFGNYSYFGMFDYMLNHARDNFHGWMRSLRQHDDGTRLRSMRNLNKPSVIGGLSLFATFMPTGNSCSFGGESDLNILYYETGTAYRRSVARGGGGIDQIDVTGDNVADNVVKASLSLGSGTTSSVGIHIGRQNDRASASGSDPEGDMVTGFVQQGTGKVVEIDIETALKIRSGLRSWRER